jgi:acyl carrier protein
MRAIVSFPEREFPGTASGTSSRYSPSGKSRLSGTGRILVGMHWREMRERLESAVSNGQLSVDDLAESKKIERILGFDSLDHVELLMGCEELGLEVRTVGDLIRFFELMDRREPPDEPPAPPMHPVPVTGPVEAGQSQNSFPKS